MDPAALTYQTGAFVAYVWKTAPDPRTRHLAEIMTDVPEWNVEPPRDLGRFNCRGDYVYVSTPTHPANGRNGAWDRYRK